PRRARGEAVGAGGPRVAGLGLGDGTWRAPLLARGRRPENPRLEREAPAVDGAPRQVRTLLPDPDDARGRASDARRPPRRSLARRPRRSRGGRRLAAATRTRAAIPRRHDRSWI